MVVSDWTAVLPQTARLAVFDARTRECLRYLGEGPRGNGPLQLRDPYGLRLLRDQRQVAVVDSRDDERGSYNLLVFDVDSGAVTCAGDAIITPDADLNRPTDLLEGEGFFVVANYYGNTLSYVPWTPSSASWLGADLHEDCDGAAHRAVPVLGASVGDSVLQYPIALALVPQLGVLVREAGHGVPEGTGRLVLFSGGVARGLSDPRR